MTSPESAADMAPDAVPNEVPASAPETQKFEFRAEIQQLLNILVHSLYTDRDIFLREAISNASDAINRFQFETLTNSAVLDPEAELAIRIHIDSEANTWNLCPSRRCSKAGSNTTSSRTPSRS